MRYLAGALVALLVVAVFSLGGEPLPPESVAAQSPTVTSQIAQVQVSEQDLVVEARVVPVRSIELSFPLSGMTVAEVLVREGDVVAQGDPLVRLDTRDLRLEVERARAQLARVRAEYDQLLEGAPRLVDIDSTKPVTVALQELAQDKLVFERTRTGIK